MENGADNHNTIAATTTNTATTAAASFSAQVPQIASSINNNKNYSASRLILYKFTDDMSCSVTGKQLSKPKELKSGGKFELTEYLGYKCLHLNYNYYPCDTMYLTNKINKHDFSVVCSVCPAPKGGYLATAGSSYRWFAIYIEENSRNISIYFNNQRNKYEVYEDQG